jgi:hypothetical protein
MFQRENHFINRRIQKPRRLNMKCIAAVNSVNKTNRNRYNSVLKISCKIFLLPIETVIVAHLVLLYYIIYYILYYMYIMITFVNDVFSKLYL